MSLQDDLRECYEQAQIFGLWYWEAGDYCSEDGFEAECYADFEQFIATLEDESR
ncbi:hypothetical protein GFS31_41700 (plasmid) [Leptolyngbya sp. BL0902]|uniref:hypothetical protein n=1 Tax=Leptolyngbya sp. BL0902 TaxID=1115757 RepID=UPI0018E88630|nr:hypothetical protein [Leptolyngbya sp. BL0902]QQE67457.1 hypothetical protein GFS31_41700 [Leptolyngbya sp. BL0902]